MTMPGPGCSRSRQRAEDAEVVGEQGFERGAIAGDVGGFERAGELRGGVGRGVGRGGWREQEQEQREWEAGEVAHGATVAQRWV